MNVRALLAAAAAFVLSGVATEAAQAQSAPLVSFDALVRSAKTDSQATRKRATGTSSAAPRARTDSARPRLVTVSMPLYAARQVDTVRVIERDTVQLMKRDTVWVIHRDSVFVQRTPDSITVQGSQRAAAAGFAAPTVTGLVQVQLTGGDSALRSTYRVRRAEVRVASDLGRRAQAIMMIDVAKSLALNENGAQTSVSQSSRVLQDAYVSVPIRGLQIDAGQQRLPLSYEGGMGSSGLETIERALFQTDRARGASFGDVRDLGVSVRGAKNAFHYKLGVFNGSGESMNETDRNVGKSLVGRLYLTPSALKGLRVGMSGATSGASTEDKPARDRLGADFVLTRGRASLQSELMTGRDGPTTRAGMYLLGTFLARPTFKLVGRYDAWDPDLRSEGTPFDVTERDYIAGVNWVPASTRLKLHVGVVYKTYANDISPAVTQLISQLQAAW